MNVHAPQSLVWILHWLEALFRGCKHCQIVRKKQLIDPAASTSDTLINLTVTVYPIRVTFASL